MSKDLQKEFDKIIREGLKDFRKQIKYLAEYLNILEAAIKYRKAANPQRKSK